MTTKTEIDRQLAELESLLNEDNRRLEETPSRVRRRMPSWLTIVGFVVVIDLAARFFVPSSMPFVLKLEAGIFLAAAVALIAPVVRGKKLAGFRIKLHKWLAAAFGLGAIRSGMWGFGVPVEYANLTIFLLGLAGLAVVYFRRNKNSDTD